MCVKQFDINSLVEKKKRSTLQQNKLLIFNGCLHGVGRYGDSLGTVRDRFVFTCDHFLSKSSGLMPHPSSIQHSTLSVMLYYTQDVLYLCGNC